MEEEEASELESYESDPDAVEEKSDNDLEVMIILSEQEHAKNSTTIVRLEDAGKPIVQNQSSNQKVKFRILIQFGCT